MRDAVLEHPGIAGAIGDHLINLVGIGTGANGQRHGFAGSGDMHASQQLIDHLDHRTGANFITQTINLAGNRVEHVFTLGVGSWRPGGHHGHFAGHGLGGTAGNRAVDHQETHIIETLAECLGKFR